MISEIEQHRREIEALCREYGVERLALFGSAATGSFRAHSSDLDFLVEFRTPLAPGYSNRYFGLLEGLQILFKRPVELVVESAITNPYFREAVDRNSFVMDVPSKRPLLGSPLNSEHGIVIRERNAGIFHLFCVAAMTIPSHTADRV